MAITLDGNNLTTVGVINSGTAQNSTSGTSIDFTGIPAGVKRITVMFNGVSTSGTSNPQLQIGAGSIETTGYSGLAWNNASGATGMSSTGFSIFSANASTNLFGTAVFTLMGSNLWVVSMSFSAPSITTFFSTNGAKTTAGTLDRVRITTVNGTDTFDAGSINILYE